MKINEAFKLQPSEIENNSNIIPIHTNWKKLITASFIFNIITILLLAPATYMLWEKMNNINSTYLKVEQLSTTVQTSVDEVVGLRQFISSNVVEDIIYLKILILKPQIDVDLAGSISKYTQKYSKQFNKDPDLTLAIMSVESDFNPDIVSNKGATGLMQIMPLWKKSLGINGDLKNPEVSIKHGLQILSFYEEMYNGNLEMALTAYNRGPGTVDSMLMSGMNPVNDYSPRIMKVYDRLKKLKTNTKI